MDFACYLVCIEISLFCICFALNIFHQFKVAQGNCKINLNLYIP